MGNQNERQRKLKIVRENDERHAFNLDDIVEQWIWQVWNKTKPKSLSRLKREDLLIKINWTNVSIKQNDVHFYNSSLASNCRTIFRTNFDNKTTNDQLHLLTTQRSTTAVLKLLYTKSLNKSKKSCLIFKLPENIIKYNGNIQCEQSIPFGRDITKEYEIPWNVNSQIHVPASSRIDAELNINEQEFRSKFCISIHISGQIHATISNCKSPTNFLKIINGDVVDIINEFMKKYHRLNSFEIIDGNLKSVCFKMIGKCSFRYPINQHIQISQRTLSSKDINTRPTAPIEYLPTSTKRNRKF